MNPYFKIGIPLGLFLLGIFIGGYITYDHMKAQQLAAVEEALAKRDKEQAGINKVEITANAGKDAETKKTLQLTQDVKHDPKLIDIKLSPTLLKQLYQASLPATRLP